MLQSHLEREDIQLALGNMAVLLADIAERLYVPNIRHNVASIPKRQDPDGIAVIARSGDQGIKMSSDFSIPSPRQYEATRNQLIAYGGSSNQASAMLDSIKRQVHDRASVSAIRPLREEGQDAITWAKKPMVRLDRIYRSQIPDPDIQAFMQICRPAVLLDTTKDSSFPALLHEEVHVYQLEDKPLAPYYSVLASHKYATDELALELEAYEYGARGVGALLKTDPQVKLTATDRNQLAVNGLREPLCSPDDPYNRLGHQTDTIAKALASLQVSTITSSL